MYSPYYDISIHTAVKATEDFPRHSEASIIELKDKSLLMAWQRYEKGAFDNSPATIAMMNSYDGGKTWENERIVAKMVEGYVNTYSPSFHRCSDGTISLLFMRNVHLVEGEKRQTNYYRIDSTDEGKTFGPEQLLMENTQYVPENNSAKRLQSGASLYPLALSEGGWCGGPSAGDHHLVVVLRSEDDFRSWTESNAITVPMRGLMEPCIAQQANGRLTMVLRTQLGSVFMSESLDDGRTWSKPQTTGLRAPESCSCVATIPGTDTQIVVWNNSEYDMHWYSHYGKRSPLTIALSKDGLRTFTDFYDLETDPNVGFSNPSITFTSDGVCLLNYWARPYSPQGYFIGLMDLKIARFRIKI